MSFLIQGSIEKRVWPRFQESTRQSKHQTRSVANGRSLTLPSSEAIQRWCPSYPNMSRRLVAPTDSSLKGHFPSTMTWSGVGTEMNPRTRNPRYCDFLDVHIVFPRSERCNNSRQTFLPFKRTCASTDIGRVWPVRLHWHGHSEETRKDCPFH